MKWSRFVRGGVFAALIIGESSVLAAPVVESPACKPSWFEPDRLAALIETHAPDAWFDRVSVRVPRCEDREALELVVSSSTAVAQRAISVADAPRSQRTRTLALVIASLEANAKDRNGSAEARGTADGARPDPRGARGETAGRTPRDREPARQEAGPTGAAAGGRAPLDSTGSDPGTSDADAETRARPLLPRDEDPLAAPVVVAPRLHAVAIEATTAAYPAKRSLLLGGALAYVYRLDALLRLTAGVAAGFGRTRLALGEVELTVISTRVGAGLCPVRGNLSLCGYAAAEAGVAIVAGVAAEGASTSTGRAAFFGLAFDVVVDYALSDAYALAARVGVRPTIRGVEGGSAEETVGVGAFGIAAGLGVVRSF
ncbi:MAG: hypothetical protein RIT81_19460 [Deltaproteobacteria bacterium]